MRIVWSCGVAFAAALALGCGGDDVVQGAGGASSSSSSAEGGGGSAASSTTGAGGAGGVAGQGGQGGQGGSEPSVECLGKEVYEAHFALKVDSLCVVASYTASHAQGYPNWPSWGRHGGLLTLQQLSSPQDAFTLTRFGQPTGPSGAMDEKVSASLGLNLSISPLYLNSKALDLANSDATVVGYDVFGSSDGELVIVNASSVLERHDVNGIYDYAMLAAKNEVGRLLYTALTPLDSATSPAKAGLYAADICKGQTGFCGKETLFQSGDATGPVVVDAAGNAFALFPNLANSTQQLRGFLGAKVAFKSPATPGTELASVAGTGSELAALAPIKEDGDGYLLFQPNDSNFVAQDPIVVAYKTDGGSIVGTAPEVGVDLVAEGAGVHLLNDDKGRIWLGVGTGMSETTYFVLDHAPLK